MLFMPAAGQHAQIFKASIISSEWKDWKAYFFHC